MDSQKRTKRKRVSNFTVHEKTILAHLVNERKDIVESKLTDNRSIQKKKKAWEVITQEFNKNFNVRKRDGVILKRAWDNLKAMTRKAKAAEQNAQREGSPDLPPHQIAIMNIVQEACPALQSEFNNTYDSDANLKCSGERRTSELSDDFSNSPEADDDNKSQDPPKVNQTENKIARGITQTAQKRVNEVVRREALLRVKALTAKSENEQEILQLQLKEEEYKTKREEIMLETAQIEQKRAEMELQAAQFELEFQKRKLHQSFLQLH